MMLSEKKSHKWLKWSETWSFVNGTVMFSPHPNNRQKSHFALKVSDMMGGWQRMLEMVLEICSNKNEKRNYEAENLSWSRLLRPCPFRVSFSLKKSHVPTLKRLWCGGQFPPNPLFPANSSKTKKRNPKRTNERTHRTAIIIITAMSAPDAKKTKPTGDPVKMLPQPFWREVNWVILGDFFEKIQVKKVFFGILGSQL